MENVDLHGNNQCTARPLRDLARPPAEHSHDQDSDRRQPGRTRLWHSKKQTKHCLAVPRVMIFPFTKVFEIDDAVNIEIPEASADIGTEEIRTNDLKINLVYQRVVIDITGN
jgi:hypothetical protein